MKTRFAPSPTGSLHIGGARTALYNYLLAKRHNGCFVLRIEDTDQERNTQASLQSLLEELTWLGLDWDEGPKPTDTTQYNGPNGPYCQSQRHTIYQSYAEKLLQKGFAYYCFATEEEIAAQKEASNETHSFKFQSPYRNLSLAEAEKKRAEGHQAVIRYKNTHQDEVFHFNDLVRGDIELPGNMIGDFVILRRDKSPVYNFCCAIDDATMEITLVLRGEEHLPNTLRQLMIYEALDLKKPDFGHLSLILDQDHKKLSKRSGASSISDFRKLGYTQEGLLNYLALLGWSDPEHREILSLSELAASFCTDRLNPAAPMYDMEKLRWVNSQQIKTYPTEKLYQSIQPFIRDLDIPKDPEWLKKCIGFFHQDFHTLAEAPAILRGFTTLPPLYTKDVEDVLKWETTNTVLFQWAEKLFNYACSMEGISPEIQINKLSKALLPSEKTTCNTIAILIKNLKNKPINNIYQTISDSLTINAEFYLPVENYQALVKEIQKEKSIKGKQLFMPIRIAMIASPHGADMKIIIQILTLKQLIIRSLSALIQEQKR
ncbi:MAG: glutamate--tRNA ligase [Pseudomonadota bacterium]|nr:glutamate--tRNA ligase [Pseudomonadota bacterium]